MERHVLLLTPWMTPHKVITWQRAVVLLFTGKVEVLEEYDEEISSPSTTINMPAVIRLTKGFGGMKRGVKFSRMNVFTRDNFQCQYCLVKKTRMRDLNYDHVVPRHKGGKTTWENIVTSCYPCNSKKQNRTPEQAGMRLHKTPVRPKTLPLTAPRLNLKNIPEEWRQYCLQMGVEWDDDEAVDSTAAA